MKRTLNWRASVTLDNRTRHINEDVEKPVRNLLRARYTRVWVLKDVRH
jgi:hypothetical protein